MHNESAKPTSIGPGRQKKSARLSRVQQQRAASSGLDAAAAYAQPSAPCRCSIPVVVAGLYACLVCAAAELLGSRSQSPGQQLRRHPVSRTACRSAVRLGSGSSTSSR